MRALLVGILSLGFLAPSPLVHALLQGNETLLVDNYDDQNSTNLLAGESRGDADCLSGFLTQGEAFGNGGASLSLEYHLTEPGSFSYFRVELAADLTEMRYLSFWVKPGALKAAPGAEFFVEIHEDTNGDQQFAPGADKAERLAVNRFVVKKREDGWEKIVIPFSGFRKIRQWNRIPELLFVLETKRQAAEAKFAIDDLLFGSNYPEGLAIKEILMQNRTSSFRIGDELADSGMKLKSRKNRLSLALTFIDPYLEEVRLEESRDGGRTWRRIHSFYDHFTGGMYKTEWEFSPASPSEREALVRALGVNLLGGESELAGPYHLNFN